MTEEDAGSFQSRGHARVVASIVAAIERGAPAYEMPWHKKDGPLRRPANAASGAAYSGINIVSLWARAKAVGYASHLWATYRQWQGLGGQVRKGERGTPIVFVTKVTSEGKDAESEPDEKNARYVWRWYNAFNRAQVSGLNDDDVQSVVEPLDAPSVFGGFIQHVGATIRFGFDKACYVPDTDTIHMPARESFTGSSTSTPQEACYATLLHELVHWTGHPSRLDRLQLVKRYGDEAYAFEELVAELGAALLCADLKLNNEPRLDHAAYIDGWLKVLKREPKALLTAASKAGAAAQYLADLVSTRKKPQLPPPPEC